MVVNAGTCTALPMILGTDAAGIDEDGNPTAEPVAYEEYYAYLVVPSEGGWAIDAANDADAG